MNPRALFEQIEVIIEKALDYGVAIQTAVAAFKSVLWPELRSVEKGGEVSAYMKCPPAFQKEILDAKEKVLSVE